MLFLKILRGGDLSFSSSPRGTFSWRAFFSLFLLLSDISDIFVTSTNTNPHTSCPTGPVVIVLNGDSNKTCVRKNQNHSPVTHQAIHLLAEDSDGNPMRIQHCGEVSLSCWAPQPVTWDYEGPVPPTIKTITLTRSSPDPQDSSSFCYNAILTLKLYGMSVSPGKFTCSMLIDNDRDDSSATVLPERPINKNYSSSKSSVYILKTVKQPVKFFRSVVPIGWKLLPNEFIVPCVTNSHNASVELEKQDPSTEQFRPVNNEDFNYTYYSHVGILVSATPGNNVSYLGKYKCKDANHGNVSIDINVENKETQRRGVISNDLEIKFHNDIPCGTVTCSSKTKKLSPTYLKFFHCTNAIHCSLRLKVLVNNFGTFSLTNDGPSFDYSCGSLTSSEVSSTAISFPSDKFGDAGMIFCSTAGGLEYQYVNYWSNSTLVIPGTHFDDSATRVTDVILYNPGQTTNPDSLMALSVSKKTLYVNETVSLDCAASDFTFSNGLKWLVKFSNGSVGNPGGMELSSKNFSSHGRLVSIWSLNVTSDDIVSYICLAPLWNSSEWMNVSFPVKIIDGKAPIILKNLSSQVEEIFSDVQKKVEIRCEAWGIPQPEMSWWRGDVEFADETQKIYPHSDLVLKENSNISISTLMFEATVNNGSIITGEYTCNATNPKGTVLHTVRVKVQSHSTWKAWAGVIGASILLVVGVLMFYLHKFWKKSEIQEKYIRQLTTRDIDLFKFGRPDLRRQHPTLKDLEDTLGCGRDIALVLPYQNQYEVSEEDVLLDEDSTVLGEGYYGVVLHGKYRTHNGETMDVAVKTLKSWNTSHAKALLDELKILTYVGKHDHVVSLVGAITNIDDSKIQVILEYCAEGSLDKYLMDKRNYFLDEISDDKICFSVHTAVTQSSASSYVRIDYAIKTFDLIRWAYQIACGMQWLSSRKIIHGDLAARNLLLTDTRDLKISDFGLSKKIAETQDQYIPSGVIQQDQPWRSLAPEWFVKKTLSSATDVWAYGITLWEIFSLAEDPYPQFPSYSPHFFEAIRTGHRNPKPRHANSYIYDILLSCWDAEPGNRPTFSELTKLFFDLLPTNYVKTIDTKVYVPKDYIFPNIAYVQHDQLVQIQTHQSC